MEKTYQTIDGYKEVEREAQNAIARLAQWGIKNLGYEAPALPGAESVGLNDL